MQEIYILCLYLCKFAKSIILYVYVSSVVSMFTKDITHTHTDTPNGFVLNFEDGKYRRNAHIHKK